MNVPVPLSQEDLPTLVGAPLRRRRGRSPCASCRIVQKLQFESPRPSCPLRTCPLADVALRDAHERISAENLLRLQ
eukprot:6586772-Pyramimonas_sp.AAC.1